jgi:hypothetical protein
MLVEIESEGEGQRGKRERYRNEEEAGIGTGKQDEREIVALPASRKDTRRSAYLDAQPALPETSACPHP